MTDRNVLNSSVQDGYKYPILHVVNGDKIIDTYKGMFEYIYNLKTDFDRETTSTNVFIPSSTKKLFNQSMDSGDITNKMYLDTF